jgi:tRNA (guanine-N7-)-methyltransferase
MNTNLEEKLWSITERAIIQSNHIIPLKRNQKISILDYMSKEKIFLEIGCGWGEVAIQLAKENTNTGFVLLEKKINRVNHILKEIKKNDLTNIKIILLNVNWFFEEIFLHNQFSEILLNFPDPWPKLRHRKHRSFTVEFTNSVLKFLCPKGRFRFATDHGGYGRSTIRLLRNNSFSQMDSFTFSLKRPDLPVSFFENLKITENKKIYYIEFYKK